MARVNGWPGGGYRRRVNPETLIVQQIREILRMLRIPHIKHVSGPISQRGIPDLIGVLPPAGRSLWIEVKVPGRQANPEQQEFLRVMREAGAVAFTAHGAREVVAELAAADYEPAKRLKIELGIAAGPRVDVEDEGGKEAP